MRNKINKVFIVSRCTWTLSNFRSGLMSELVRRKHDVYGGGAVGDGYERKIEEIGVKLHALPIDKRAMNPVSDLILLIVLYRWYQKEKPDVVHHFTIKPVIYGTIAAKMAGIERIVNTIPGLGYAFSEDGNRWLRRLVERLYRFALHFADSTIFQNRDDYAYFVSRQLVDANRSMVIPGSGVNCEFFKPEKPEKKGCDSSVTFLMVSRLLKDKGIYDYVEAARLVKKHYATTRFELLGGRDVRNPQVIPEEDLTGWRKEGIVGWRGEVSDVRPFIRESDVVVLPSYYREGIPRSLMEAAAMGKPIITTDSIGCREVVEEGVNGLLVPKKNPDALSRAMLYLMKNPEERNRMGAMGRKKVESEFNEKEVIRATIEQYQLN